MYEIARAPPASLKMGYLWLSRYESAIMEVLPPDLALRGQRLRFRTFIWKNSPPVCIHSRSPENRPEKLMVRSMIRFLISFSRASRFLSASLTLLLYCNQFICTYGLNTLAPYNQALGVVKLIVIYISNSRYIFCTSDNQSISFLRDLGCTSSKMRCLAGKGGHRLNQRMQLKAHGTQKCMTNDDSICGNSNARQ